MRKKQIYFLLLCIPLSVVHVYSQRYYYGKDDFMPLSVESTTTPYITIQLAGGIELRDYGETSQYTIPDHLGSTRVILDGQTLNTITSCEYCPYGAISASVPESQKSSCKYTQTYVWNANTGMYASPSRYYLPTARRFLSLDPQRQNYNAYGYANSNPIRFRDVSGEITLDQLKAQILQNPDFQKLAATPSYTRLTMGHEYRRIFMSKKEKKTLDKHIAQLSDRNRQARMEILTKNAAMKNSPEGFWELVSEGTFKEVIYKSGTANCGDCARIMASEMQKAYPSANVEVVNVGENNPRNHDFALLNRDVGTDISNPVSWNEDVLAVDAWAGNVLTQQEFIHEYIVAKNSVYRPNATYKITQKKLFPRDESLPSLVDPVTTRGAAGGANIINRPSNAEFKPSEAEGGIVKGLRFG